MTWLASTPSSGTAIDAAPLAMSSGEGIPTRTESPKGFSGTSIVAASPTRAGPAVSAWATGARAGSARAWARSSCARS